MKGLRKKNKADETKPPVDQLKTDDLPIADPAQAETIEDFIGMKRLQNRILEKLIDQLSNPDNKEQANNK
jgi:hypothetical protein